MTFSLEILDGPGGNGRMTVYRSSLLYLSHPLDRTTVHLLNTNCFMNSCFFPKVNRLNIEIAI